MAETFTLEASAPGKLIIFGEHAVVYGAAAIAASLSHLRTHVVLQLIPEPELLIELPNILARESEGGVVRRFQLEEFDHLPAVFAESGIAFEHPFKPTEEVAAALWEVVGKEEDELAKAVLIPLLFLYVPILHMHLRAAGVSLPLRGARMYVRSRRLPIGAGLGSSASFCSAAAGALVFARKALSIRRDDWADVLGAGLVRASDSHAPLSEAGVPTQPFVPGKDEVDLVNAWAFATEALFHGTPSGLDNTVSCYGGAMLYVREPRHVATITNLPPLRVLLTNTKVPRSTKDLVTRVGVTHRRLQLVLDPMFRAIDGVARRAFDILTDAAEAATLAATLAVTKRASTPAQTSPAAKAPTPGTESAGAAAQRAKDELAAACAAAVSAPQKPTAEPASDPATSAGAPAASAPAASAPGGSAAPPMPRLLTPITIHVPAAEEEGEEAEAGAGGLEELLSPTTAAWMSRGRGDSVSSASAHGISAGQPRLNPEGISATASSLDLAALEAEEEAEAAMERVRSASGADCMPGRDVMATLMPSGGTGQGAAAVAAEFSASLHEQLAELVEINQHLLVALGVSHPALETVHAESQALGMHAKLTGAGGGGCAFTLLPPASAARSRRGSFCSTLGSDARHRGSSDMSALAGTGATPSAADLGSAEQPDASHAKSPSPGRVRARTEPVVGSATPLPVGEVLQSRLESHGFDCFQTEVGGYGLLVHLPVSR